MDDRLHQQYRLPHLGGAAELMDVRLRARCGGRGALRRGAKRDRHLRLADRRPFGGEGVERRRLPGHGDAPAVRHGRRAADPRRGRSREPRHAGRHRQEPWGAAPVQRASICRSAPGAAWPSSGPTAPARRPCSRSSPASRRPTAGTVTRAQRPRHRLPAPGGGGGPQSARDRGGAYRGGSGERHRATHAPHRVGAGRRERRGGAGRAHGRVRPTAASVRGDGRLRPGGGGTPHPGRARLRGVATWSAAPRSSPAAG